MTTDLLGGFAYTFTAYPFFLVLNLMDTHRPYNTRPRPDLPDRSSEGA